MNGMPAADLELAEAERLEQLVDRTALGEICESFFHLFGLPVRILGQAGATLAEVTLPTPIFSRSAEGSEPVHKLAEVLQSVREHQPEAEQVLPGSGDSVYRVAPIVYQDRLMGHCVLGPYIPLERSVSGERPSDTPPAIQSSPPTKVPRLKGPTMVRLTRHLTNVLDLILFAGHQAHLTSSMHLASVRASFDELSQSTEDLRSAYERLQELDRHKSRFLATVSHELRTPLTSIIGYAEMLGSDVGGSLTEDQQSFVNTIRGRSDHLLKLITSLLEMARFDQGAIQLQKERIDPHELTSEVVDTSKLNAAKKGIMLELNCEEGLQHIDADAVRLRQVLQNLVDNAIKFTPEGGTVELNAAMVDVAGDPEAAAGAGLVLMQAPGRELELRVKDSGVGIPENEHARIFDAFYQVDGSTTREHGGTGLGLSIVHKLIEAHGGTIRVESEAGRGACFIVTLPLHFSPE